MALQAARRLTTAKPRLGYWNTRAIGEPIRLLLALADIEYEDVRYQVGPPPTYDKTEWTDVKYSLGLLAPNLPYWIEPESGLKLTQSRAILFHIAAAHGLADRARAARDDGPARRAARRDRRAREAPRRPDVRPELRQQAAHDPARVAPRPEDHHGRI